MTGGACREKQHGILFSNWIGFFNLTKQFRRIRELRFKLLANLFADFITAAMNSGTNRGFEIAGTATESPAHLARSLLDRALDRPPPACVKHSNSAPLGINENDGQAIRGLNSQQQTGSRGDQAIANKVRFSRGVNSIDKVGVNLAQRNQRPK